MKGTEPKSMVRQPLWRRAWEGWKVIAHVIGNFQALVLLSVFYFVIVPPFALIVKAVKDPLRFRTAGGDSFWLDRPAPDLSSDDARWRWYRRQY